MSDVISIDLGNQNVVVCKGGGTMKTVEVVTMQGRRIFPTKIAYDVNKKGEFRQFACDTAEMQEAQNPQGTLSNLKRLVNESFGAFKKENYLDMNAEITSPPDGTLTIKLRVKEKEIEIPIQQALSLIFMRLFDICKESYPDVTKDSTVVVSVSPSWGDAERRIIIDSLSVAGLNNAYLINSTTAAAISYYIRFLRKSNESQNVAIVDMGDSSLDISVSSIEINEKVTNINVDYFISKNLGGKNFTDVLIDYIFELINKPDTKNEINITEGTTTDDIKKNPFAMNKIRKSAEVSKRNMKLNNQVVFQCLNVLPGKDIKMFLFLDQFVKHCDNLLSELRTTVTQFYNDFKNKKLTAFEANGGAYRFEPVASIFKDAITETINGTIEITNCLNAEECFAEGALYWGLSIGKKLAKPINLNDTVPYNVSMFIDDISPILIVDKKKAKTGQTIKVDVDFGSRKTNTPLTFKQWHDSIESAIEIGNIITFNQSGKVTFSFKIDTSNIFTVFSAEKREKTIEIKYNPKVFFDSDMKAKSQKFYSEIQKLTENEVEHDKAEYEIQVFVHDIKNGLDEGGYLRSYIKNDKIEEYQNTINKYLTQDWSLFNTEMIKYTQAEIEKLFEAPFNIKKSWDEADQFISNIRAEAKKIIDDTKLPTKKAELKKIHNEFLKVARESRQKLEGCEDKTDLITEEHRILNDLKSNFISFNYQIGKVVASSNPTNQ